MESAPSAPQPPKASVVRRYKFAWRLLFAANLALGAYMFLGVKKKDADPETGDRTKEHIQEGKAVAELSSVPIESTSPPATVEPPKVREPTPADQQLELFKWMLEEKRKVKPKDPEEKKRIDEEKAILKHFIKTRSVPNLKF